MNKFRDFFFCCRRVTVARASELPTNRIDIKDVIPEEISLVIIFSHFLSLHE